MTTSRLAHEFVEVFPAALESGKLYISTKFRTTAHLCCCGCGSKVVTPLSPADWELTFNGETVTLYPSIGNWNYPCRSHYWIRKGQVIWAEDMTDSEIETVRRQNQILKDRYVSAGQQDGYEHRSASGVGIWKRIYHWFFRR